MNKKIVCNTNMCTGCGACVEKCIKNAICVIDNLDSMNAVIDTDKCINCGACFKVCPNNNSVKLRNQQIWYQGWTTDKTERRKSSSGGLATVLSKHFVRNGGIVCSCVLEKDKCIFKFADTEDKIEFFRGSKYVKSNPLGIYKEIKRLLQENKKILFIGLPCQVAAVNNFVGEQNCDNLYTVDLICHGTPSIELLKKYLSQYDVSISNNISFRSKNEFMLKVDGVPFTDGIIQDSYTISFLSALNYTENCYHCNYATEKRIGDITIGDAWGSDLNEEMDKGISLVMCQSEKGERLIEKLPFHFEKININKALEHNHQLRHPAAIPHDREEFFKKIKEGKSYNSVVRNIYPKLYFKYKVKKVINRISKLYFIKMK